MEKKSLIKNWNDIEKELDDKFYSALDSISISGVESTGIPQWKKYFKLIQKSWLRFLDSFLTPKVLALAGSLAILLVISIYSIAYINRSDLFYLAELETEKQVSLRTEAGTSSLTEGLQSFDDGKYKTAIEKFQFYLQKNPENYSANFYIGLCFLNISKTGLPGLAYKYNESEVKKGITYLNSALSFVNENQYYQEDCYWYLGKAYLMIEDVHNAKLQFNKIINLGRINSLREEKAREMISVLSLR